MNAAEKLAYADLERIAHQSAAQSQRLALEVELFALDLDRRGLLTLSEALRSAIKNTIATRQVGA